MILVISVLQSTAVSQEILIFQEAFKLSWRSLVLCYSVCKFQLLFSFTIIFYYCMLVMSLSPGLHLLLNAQLYLLYEYSLSVKTK